MEGREPIATIKQKYILYEEIGHGKFGKVFSGINRKTKENVAIKMENVNSPIRLLKNEAKILKYLYDHGCRQIPLIYWYGMDDSFSINYALLVMPFYEGSLYNVSPTSLDKAMISSIQILESVHKQFVIHRDIKPDNFMVKSGELFLIDFGMATFYIDGFSKHIIESGSQMDSEIVSNNTGIGSYETILGTPNYVSYYIHCGLRGSRRDDLISLGYMYLMLHNKSLPWQNLEVQNDNASRTYPPIHVLHPRNQARKLLKERENLKKVCVQTNQKICDFLMYCYDLDFDEKPDYDLLYNAFREK
uniref:non-specific serine/threonine protein kinase n=1 Tax=viral metagenome TaxID=1070528 RepID=A0A6C0D407_9ZZZZ